jgi:hypothetical protein
MTDEEIVVVVTRLFRRAQAGEFGRVGGLKPSVHVKMNPFAVQIGTLYLSRVKAVAVAEGRLTVEARPLGWVLVGQAPRERTGARRKVKEHESLKGYIQRRVAERTPRKPIQTPEQRRAEYLREVGRDMILRKEA